jgi:hypothetical protein
LRLTDQLFKQSKCHRIPKVLAVIGLDAANDDHNQAEYYQGKNEKKSNNDKNQKERNQSINK